MEQGISNLEVRFFATLRMTNYICSCQHNTYAEPSQADKLDKSLIDNNLVSEK